MSGGETQSTFRKALGALKDSTTVSLAKVNSDYKDLDIAIVKATNHVERPAKERHLRAIFSAISATRPRADVAYCIHSLAKRLSKTRNWAVALKTLIVIHRALREVDPTFHEELINYGKRRSHMLHMAHFKDDSSAKAWDYSAWIRAYALYLEERLECFRVLNYDVETDKLRTKELETPELMVQLPVLQQLLSRLLACQPQGTAIYNHVIQLALSIVASESIKIYQAINDGMENLVDKFFEMSSADAFRAFEIYKKACYQAEHLSEFYEVCKNVHIGRRENFSKIEQPPASFLRTMEEYVNNAPHVSLKHKDKHVKNEDDSPKEILAIEYKKEEEVPAIKNTVQPERIVVPAAPPIEPEKAEVPAVPLPDLLNLDDPSPVASELFEKNALALAIVPAEVPSAIAPSNRTTGWEVALVTAPSSNGSTSTASQMAGGLDKLTLDSLYDDAIRRRNQPVGYNNWERSPVMGQQNLYDPFYASNGVPPSSSVQMAAINNQQQAFMLQQQQQQQMMMRPYLQHPIIPAANPFANNTQHYVPGVPQVPTYHSGLL